MMRVPHELPEEFPQEASLIERLTKSNYQFGKLAARYDEVKDPSHRIRGRADHRRGVRAQEAAPEEGRDCHGLAKSSIAGASMHRLVGAFECKAGSIGLVRIARGTAESQHWIPLLWLESCAAEHATDATSASAAKRRPNYPEIARYLAELGIDSISVNPSSAFRTMQVVYEAEASAQASAAT